MKTGLYRLSKGNTAAWVHFSQGRKKTILRWIQLDDHVSQFDNNADKDQKELAALLTDAVHYSFSDIAARIADVLPFDPTHVSYTDRDELLQIVERLEELVQPPRVSAATTRHVASTIVVPQTRLRRFYETLRLFPDLSVHTSVCNALLRGENIDKLQVLFKEALLHLNQYDNREQSFHSREPKEWLHIRDQETGFAKCLVARLRPCNGQWCDAAYKDTSLKFRAVDYEVSPLRTAGHARLESGKPAMRSGAGGMDLLLQHEDGTPIIGEIKAPTDTNPFVALVQSLTYASELLTPLQCKRLKHVYPSLCAGGRCDIYVISAHNDKERNLLCETKKIAHALLESKESVIAKSVRRIAFLTAELKDNASVTCRCTHLCGR